ncbi:MAG: Unknown protein [uncultured Sulfurovum sp.]|uniref:Uncharacterized protein n=1 Tax=uncultured Sulfurovum sp. TaxID=269237 RepID=A0A6S6TLC2_9BACT|nr:MAG: Unknown protein [uncultured Sulfurovum sp.]
MKSIIRTMMILTLVSVFAMGISTSAYLIAIPTSLSNVQSKLQKNGFRILGTHHNVITITNKELQNTNTYTATLQVYVGSSGIRIQNPEYFGAAYLDHRYKQGYFQVTMTALIKVFGNLKGSQERLNSNELSNYRFMPGMPQFKQFISVCKTEKVQRKIQGNKNILYTLPLPNGTILVGHRLSTGTNGFLRKLGQTKNSQILPYEVLIYSNEVKMMHPKFYLALSLPQLSMDQFMKIADIPDKIERDIRNAYK